jgi:hypothetical protein
MDFRSMTPRPATSSSKPTLARRIEAVLENRRCRIFRIGAWSTQCIC